MEEEKGIQEELKGSEEKNHKDEIFTRVVRAGKRTYFFDVKATRKDDYYLTITESKKRLAREGKIFYEKHKIFLYKEDFEKFTEGLRDAVQFIDNEPGQLAVDENLSEINAPDNKEILVTEEFTNVEFDDLGKK